MNSPPLDSDLIFITKEEAGQRLDKILAERFQEMHSRTYFQTLIDERLVLLNGVPVKKRVKPQEGDEIEIQFVAAPELQLLPENIPLDVLYEDEYLIAINKPVGMVVHPAVGNWTGTFVNALLYHCREISSEDSTLRPGIVHRLDKETSGVLIAAKTSKVQQKLTELFASRQIYKEYLAICIGRPKDGEIDAPIGRHPVHRKQMAIVPTGRKAISFCKTKAWNEKLSIVQVVISTGRTHQIRVHLKYLGTPILGDGLYGNIQINKQYGVDHQLLHASVLRFIHPITGQPLEFKAPPPSSMIKFIKKIDPNFEY